MAASTSFFLQIPEPDVRTTEWEKCFVCQINEAKSAKLTERGGDREVPFPDFPEDYIQISRIPEDFSKISRIPEDFFKISRIPENTPENSRIPLENTKPYHFKLSISMKVTPEFILPFSEL